MRISDKEIWTERAQGQIIFETNGVDRFVIAGNGSITPLGEATFLVAATDAPTTVRNRADYRCDGVNDEVESVSAYRVPFRLRKGGAKLISMLRPGDHVIFDKIDRGDVKKLVGLLEAKVKHTNGTGGA